jgi:hypothetical protein
MFIAAWNVSVGVEAGESAVVLVKSVLQFVESDVAVLVVFTHAARELASEFSIAVGSSTVEVEAFAAPVTLFASNPAFPIASASPCAFVAGAPTPTTPFTSVAKPESA